MPVQELENAQALCRWIEMFVAGIDGERAELLKKIPTYAERANLKLEDLWDD